MDRGANPWEYGARQRFTNTLGVRVSALMMGPGGGLGSLTSDDGRQSAYCFAYEGGGEPTLCFGYEGNSSVGTWVV